MCVCVYVTQLSYKKNCKLKMSFFYDLKQVVFQRRESVVFEGFYERSGAKGKAVLP